MPGAAGSPSLRQVTKVSGRARRWACCLALASVGCGGRADDGRDGQHRSGADEEVARNACRDVATVQEEIEHVATAIDGISSTALCTLSLDAIAQRLTDEGIPTYDDPAIARKRAAEYARNCDKLTDLIITCDR